MSVDDRPADDPVEALAALRREFEDFKATLASRAIRRPTGDIEPTFRTTAKPDTLLLIGGLYLKSEYEALWQWAQDNGAVTSGFFKDSSTTTFAVPDLRGRALIGAGFLDPYNYPLGLAFGFAKHTLLHDQMPSHSHVTNSASHEHAASGGHNHSMADPRYLGSAVNHHHAGGPGQVSESPGTSNGIAAAIWTNSVGHHTHGFNGSHHHGSTDRSGTGQQFDLLQPSIAVNFLIWT